MSVSTGNDYYTLNTLNRLGTAKTLAKRMGFISNGAETDTNENDNNNKNDPKKDANVEIVVQDRNNNAKLVKKTNIKLDITVKIRKFR